MGKEITHSKSKPQVLIIPFPAQGHINPALAFGKHLTLHGLLVTVIVSTNVCKSANISPCSSITIESISDGSEDVTERETIEGYFKRFKTVFSKNIEKFMDARISFDFCPKVVVYDSTMPWVLDIAHERGLLGASFFTQSCGVSAVYYHLKQGSIKFPYELDSTVSLPSLPTLGTNDLPSLFESMDPKGIVLKHLSDQFSNLEKANWIFFNTFDKLEIEVFDWMASQWPIKTIGPTFSLPQTDKYNTKHAINLFEPKHETCKSWLDSKKTGSVIYVSFGSIASLNKEQMEEVAYGLITSNSHFLWVVRASEVDKLPSNFTSLASEKGLIVIWCHQPDVLAHRALACFMTHCGWNSTLEALIHGVPIIAMPQWTDQITNSKFIEDVWRVGVRVKHGDNGIVSREEIAMCVEKFVHGNKGIDELKMNACRFKDMANEAVQIGGTSANNIEDFVTKLYCDV